MKFDIPKIVRPLKLADYAEELGDTVVWVWVNPPLNLLEHWGDLASESLKALDRLNQADVTETIVEEVRQELERIGMEETAIISELWSQKAGSEWSGQDILTLVESTQATDPALWVWMQTRTRALIREHRNGAKKA